MAWALVFAAGGCSAEHYSERADSIARGLLNERDATVLGDREAWTLYPDLATPEPTPPPPPEPSAEGEEAEPQAETEPTTLLGVPLPKAPQVLNLSQALAIAYTSNRDMIFRREGLLLQALALADVRQIFAPQLDLVLSYLFGTTPGTPDSNEGSASFRASKILSTGAVLSLDASTGVFAQEGLSGVYDSLVTLRLAQPLLRGGGYAITHEPLVQAERDLVYAIRDFELFRQDFSIDVARRFYDLVNQKQSIDNQKQNLDSNEFGRRQAEALEAVGRARELDVLRARRSELDARNSMLQAQEGVQLSLDTFRIFLGLPEDQPIDVEPDPPDFTTVQYDVISAIEVAMENRLDLMNRREQLQDAERAVRLSKNGLLPDLNVELSTSYSTLGFDSLGGDQFDRNDSSLAVTLGLPVQRVNERNAYRRTEIALDRERRGLEQFEDELRVSIRGSFRELARRQKSLEISRQLIEDQTKNLRIAELRFERGELDNRDVVDARRSLLNGQNNLINEQVNYEIARLRLLSDLGILFIDETGMWKR